MTVPIAHVGGVPVEELLPLAVAWLAAAGASVRHMIAARQPSRGRPPVHRPEDLP
jgi:hypothetical protein